MSLILHGHQRVDWVDMKPDSECRILAKFIKFLMIQASFWRCIEVFDDMFDEGSGCSIHVTMPDYDYVQRVSLMHRVSRKGREGRKEGSTSS